MSEAGQVMQSAYVGDAPPVEYAGNGRLPEPTAPILPNKIRDIHITGLSYGYLVTVGCSNFAIEKPSDLIAKLSEYINNPSATEQKWVDGKLF